jgi:hypothetical protein
MKLDIHSDTTIKDVQRQFNTLYPFLQLHFIKPDISGGKYNSKQRKLPADFTIEQSKYVTGDLTISVDNKITVAELLKHLGDLGLLAQVYRKSGNHWVETSLTADWTLERQNREAMLISIPDYDLFSWKNASLG